MIVRLLNPSITLPRLQVTSKTQAVADFHMELLLKEAYDQVKDMVGRNRAALDVLVEALLANSTIRRATWGAGSALRLHPGLSVPSRAAIGQS